MPIFEVRVEERHREVVAELHHTFRDCFYEAVYEVEAETEVEAQETWVRNGEQVYRDFVDHGDYYDSEFIETLEVIDSDLMEEIVQTVEEESAPIPYVPSPTLRHHPIGFPKVTNVLVLSDPSWEV